MESVQINVLPEDAKGRYANFISVTAQERDVVIDFMSVVHASPHPPQGHLVSRIFLNRFAAKDLARLLSEIEGQWEKQRYEAEGPSSS